MDVRNELIVDPACCSLSRSFDPICSFGPDAAAILGRQPAGVRVPCADAAPPAGPAAEHQRAAQTAVAAAQHAGGCEHFNQDASGCLFPSVPLKMKYGEQIRSMETVF